MWREEQSLWDVMSPLYQESNETDKNLKRLRLLIEIPWGFLNFSYTFKRALKLLWLADTQRRYSRLCNDVVCPLGGRYFFKNQLYWKFLLCLFALNWNKVPWMGSLLKKFKFFIWTMCTEFRLLWNSHSQIQFWIHMVFHILESTF